MRLDGRIAIVTGADSGIGQATAVALAEEGADVAITDLVDADGAETTRQLVEAAGRRALVIQADQRDEAGERVRDPLRADYLRRHVAAALEAKRAGADLRGYFAWSLVDNFEWLSRYTKRLGLVRVDFETQRRTLKDSFFAYGDLIAAHRDGR